MNQLDICRVLDKMKENVLFIKIKNVSVNINK